jgi:uncharacterized protein (UPF0332 family)
LKGEDSGEGELEGFSRLTINAMNLREAADYEAKFSESGAKAVIASAERFIHEAEHILNTED